MNQYPIYVLDFDGVICDSALETAVSGWKAARTIWPDLHETVPPALIDQFRFVRPMLETGYEAILAMRLLALGDHPHDIISGYHDRTQALLDEAGLTVNQLKELFGITRDTWIAQDLSGWVEKNPLFDGVADRLQDLGRKQIWYILTTKHERFVKQILQANHIGLPDERIYGLDRNMSKAEVLAGLVQIHRGEPLHFIEDRLPALVNIAKIPALSSVKLSLALWGYNTAEEKLKAANNNFNPLKLSDFLV